MPNLVTPSFFAENDLVIPNLSNPADLERVNSFIDKYEPACLLAVLGYPLYKLIGVESSQRMTDLLSGAEFIDGEGETRKWQGIIHDTTISFIANFIFCKYQEWKSRNQTGNGTSIPNKEAGTSISPGDIIANSWNFYSSEVYDMTCFLWLKKDGNGVRVYPEFSYNQFIETRRISRTIDSVFPF